MSADVGLFGPGSASWRIDREVIVLAGGTCALLMQLAHPAVAAGVDRFSDFQDDPFARLRRTLVASFDVVFGTTPRAAASLDRINAIHRSVRGTIPETGAAYDATDPALLLWVHATLIDTALRVYDRYVAPLTQARAEAYHREGRLVAMALGIPAAMIPDTLSDLRAGMAERIESGEVRVTPTARRLGMAVLYPTDMPPRFVWDCAHLISLSVMPAVLRRGYGIAWSPGRERGADRLAGVTRRFLPLVPALLRHVPQARSAERRLRDASTRAKRPDAAAGIIRAAHSPARDAAAARRHKEES